MDDDLILRVRLELLLANLARVARVPEDVRRRREDMAKLFAVLSREGSPEGNVRSLKRDLGSARAQLEDFANNEPLARTALNRVKARYGLPLVPGTLTGGALLQAIYEEAYVSLFQNIEEWNWYKRSCYPNISPSSGTYIPRRVYYSVDERNANPNIPAPDTPGNTKTENPVDPGLAVTPYNGAACLGQANTP
jgi:hypothetical protein